jgi:hypothetical protein
MKIYIVSGSTGEYSDRTDWMVCAYKSEDEAKRIVAEYDRIAKEIEVRCRLDEDDPLRLDRYSFNRWHGDDRPKWPHPDPDFSMDYTGTTYGYGEVELVE